MQNSGVAVLRRNLEATYGEPPSKRDGVGARGMLEATSWGLNVGLRGIGGRHDFHVALSEADE